MMQKSIVALLLAVVAAEESAKDGSIYIIRHGEKNSKGDLSDTGEKRAKYIATIFPGSEFNKPGALFAGHYSHGTPQRTLHTVQPTADHLHLKVDDSIKNEDHSGAAKAFLKEAAKGKVVLAAWEHCNIRKTCYALASESMCDKAFMRHAKSDCGWWEDCDGCSDHYDGVVILTVKHGKVTAVEHHHEDFHHHDHFKSNFNATMAEEAPWKYARGYKRRQIDENEVIEVATITEEDKKNAPSAVDWSQKGATTPVKNQGQCGSCWAFSTTEGIESATFMATGKLPNLSTQQIISCDKQDDGCNGGDPATALAYVEKAGGLDTSADYPDKSHNSGSTGRCTWDKKETVKVTAWKYAIKPCTSGKCKNQDEDALAAALAKYGPISICVNAETWDSYQSGIYKHKCSGAANALDHCVQLVGYDRSGSTPYWKVRNSWTTSWGESGFIRLPFGKNACGVADEAYIITATTTSENVVV